MAIGRDFRHRFQDCLLYMSREFLVQLGRRNGILHHMLLDYSPYAECSKRLTPGQEFVSDAAKCILIYPLTHHALKLLWCHVIKSAFSRGSSGICHTQQHGTTKVGEEHLTFAIKDDIAWLEVTMYDVLLMHILHCFPKLRKDD